VSWSPGGKWLASGGHDKTVRLWSTSNWAPGPVLGPHDYYISSLAWSHDSQTLAVGRQDGFVNAYHPPDKTPIWTTPQTAPIWSLVWKPDDSELLSSDGNSTERHWKRDGTAGKVFPAQLTRIAAIAIGSDGKQLAIGGSDHFFRLWDFSDKLSPVLAGPSLDVRKVVWHPDGTRFATLGDDGSVRIWNAATGKSVTELKTQGNRPTTLAWSHNGKRLATGGQGPSIHLWQADGAAGPVFDRQPDEVLALDWNVDNKCLAVGYGDKDKTIRLINAATGKVGPVCKGHKQAIFDVKWSPDGKRLASASSDGTVRTWQANGQAMAVLQGDWLQRTLAWSPDGKLILGGSIEGTCRLWRADGSLVRAWHAHDAEVTAVAFSNDGQELFSAGNDSVLRCWSSARGDCRRVLVCLHDQQAALFSSSGECLDLPPETAKEFICLIEKPDRSLELVTPAEFEKRWKAAVEK
jgi:WD40 repeat protein